MKKDKLILPDVYPVACHTEHIGLGSTFVAVKGLECSGEQFIEEAISKGATKIVQEISNYNKNKSEKYCNIEFSFVENPRKELVKLVKKSLGNLVDKLKIIGITGTKGKTTTAFLVEHVLRCAGYKTALIGTIKNKILDCETESILTTPESDYLHMFFAECVKKGVEYVVMEVSSHSLALQRVYGISFEVIGFTNLNSEHMDFHKTLDHYFESKFRLFNQVKYNGRAVINVDDEWGRMALQNLSRLPIASELNVVLFGDKNYKFKRDLNLGIKNRLICDFDIEKSDIKGLCFNLKEQQNREIHTPCLFGHFNAYNICMAYLMCRHFKVNSDVIVKAIKEFKGVPGRLQMHKLKNGSRAFVDFAHNPSSMQAVLKTLRTLTNHLIVLFGCGGDRDKTKRPVMGRLASIYGDVVIITDDNPRNENSDDIITQIYDGILPKQKGAVVCIKDRKSAIIEAVKRSRKESIIAILGKGHESYYLKNGKKLYFNDFEEISVL